MQKLFTHSAKVVFELPANHTNLVKDMIQRLTKRLSSFSGEDAEQNGNSIYFAITPSALGPQFIGIDSGEVTIEVQESIMIINYRLSYLLPFVPFLVLDILLFWLSGKFPSNFEVFAFATIVALFLGLCIIGIIVAIILFPGIIYDTWSSVNRK